ncbi:MAG: TauD/TfdA family dioxygenase [Myxococcota bacterium]|nr:TauD/TfdA family dioxygenase [Myxococcota bacterium]
MLDVRPLQPTFGAEVGGVDLRRPISDPVRDAIKAALLRYKVIFFRDQDISPEQHSAFAARFGSFYVPPGIAQHETIPHIQKIAIDFSAPEARRPPCTTTIEASFHTDTSWRLVPSWGAILRAVHLPEVGGDTIWVDAGAAYARLPGDIKARLAELYATHDARHGLRRAGLEYPIVAHPIVRRHPETGEQILWVSFNQRPHIIGVDLAEGRELLQIILDQYRTPECQLRFSWVPMTIAFWDNRATVHYGVSDYGTFPRLLHRILIADPATPGC